MTVHATFAALSMLAAAYNVMDVVEYTRLLGEAKKIQQERNAPFLGKVHVELAIDRLNCGGGRAE